MELWTGVLSWWKCHWPWVLASSDGISSWTPLKPQHSNLNPFANQLWCSDFLTLPTPLIIPHRLPAFLEFLMPLKNWCSIQDGRKAVWSIPYVSVAFFPSLKQNYIAYCSSNVSRRPDCIFEIHQLCQSGYSRVHSNSCCSCPFEHEIIKIGQSSHKMYSNNILNVQESTIILNVNTKKVWKPIKGTLYLPFLTIRPYLMAINKKKRTRHIGDFAVSDNYKVKKKKVKRLTRWGPCRVMVVI